MPRKLTVTRVAMFRSRQLTEQGIRAFHRAATADGADRSGLTALTYATMTSYAADAALAVALANTLFFSAATAESRGKVALYLLITVAPFGLIAPVVGPALDRVQRGRRLALAGLFAGRVVLAVVLARYFGTWGLYPVALGMLVLSKAYGVLMAAVTPRVLPSGMTLVKSNSRLTVFGLAAGLVSGAVAAGIVKLAGSPGALVFVAAVCLTGAVLCLRIPAWVEVTEGEVPASLTNTLPAGGRRRQPMAARAVTALWGNATVSVLTGFLTLFVAFVVKAQTVREPFVQLALLGLVGAAAGVGSFAGNMLGARRDFGRPGRVIVGCLGMALASTVLATLLPGILTAALVGLVAGTVSALAGVSLDAVIQREMPEASRASAFGRAETILQLAWVLGGALGILLPPTYWVGFLVVSVLLALGTLQTVMTGRGTSLVSRLRPAPATQASHHGSPVR